MRFGLSLFVLICVWCSPRPVSAATDPLSWPEITSQTRPWTYWWWMGSAVDERNLSAELKRYQQAGLGGVHIIPIYGARGYENQFVGYLTPQWMDLLSFSVSTAASLGMGVDMTTGSGWCFGGPLVSDAEANANVVSRAIQVEAGRRVPGSFEPKTTQALMAFSTSGEKIDLLPLLSEEGSLAWSPSNQTWTVYVITQKPSGQKVKRAAPGAQGHMLNLAYPTAMESYLDWFGQPFTRYRGAKPRAQYHDSYEYRTDWAPDFFASFEKLRGYRLQDELPALFSTNATDRAARVKSDYRQTLSDIMIESTTPMWVNWSRENGFLTRNEAHGSPGNWLDLYAAADIPETEMFHTDRNKLISKFASSAAHVMGKQLVASETGTWLKEHFTETLADMKYLLDDLFLSGVNHVFYHGTCYSPDDATWPGWLFYASYEMNPRNPVWHDVPALNTYAARCQSILQSGQPDHDVLLYWPLHDLWHDSRGMVRNLTVHARDWFEDQPVGHAADRLWKRGYAFDYISDRQIGLSMVKENGTLQTPGSDYRVLVIPQCRVVPLETLQHLANLARNGATLIFEAFPGDVSGWGGLERKRQTFAELKQQLLPETSQAPLAVRTVGRGRVIMGDLDQALEFTRVPRETMFDSGLMCIRRQDKTAVHYFIANRSETDTFDDPVTLASTGEQVVLMNPMTGATGLADSRAENGALRVDLKLEPGCSVILRVLQSKELNGETLRRNEPVGKPFTLTNAWNVRFVKGGPTLPPQIKMSSVLPWSEIPETENYGGTAVYETRFDLPPDAGQDEPVLWELNLGQVSQSARVRLNGKAIATLITPPWRLLLEQAQPQNNLLEVEVTSTAANRIRDLDKRGVVWRKFYDINFVNINYKPFDASNWPAAPCGLQGPVTLLPVTSH